MKYLSILVFAFLFSSCCATKKTTEQKEIAQLEVPKKSEMPDAQGGAFEPPKEVSANEIEVVEAKTIAPQEGETTADIPTVDSDTATEQNGEVDETGQASLF